MTYEEWLDFYNRGLKVGVFNELFLKLSYTDCKAHEEEWKESRDYMSYLNGQKALETILGIPHEDKQEEKDKDYVVNFCADIDIRITAKNPQEAREKAKKFFGEHENESFDYVYITDIRFVTDENGNEC